MTMKNNNTRIVLHFPEGTAEHLKKAFMFAYHSSDPCPYKRPAMTGVCIDRVGITGTDGRTLVHFPFDAEWRDTTGIDMPYGMTLYDNFTQKLPKNIDMALKFVQDKGYTMVADRGTIESKEELKHDYPNYWQVVPKMFYSRIAFDDTARKALIKKMLDTVRQGNTVDIEFGCHVMKTWLNPDQDTHFTEFLFENETDDDLESPFRLKFNAKYFLRILRTLKHTVMNVCDNLSPVKFSGGDGWAILMPMI
jgi:hypothetical protein